MHGQLAWALLGGFPLVQVSLGKWTREFTDRTQRLTSRQGSVLRRHGYQRLERRQELPVEVVPQFIETVKVTGGGAGAAIELRDRSVGCHDFGVVPLSY